MKQGPNEQSVLTACFLDEQSTLCQSYEDLLGRSLRNGALEICGDVYGAEGAVHLSTVVSIGLLPALCRDCALRHEGDTGRERRPVRRWREQQMTQSIRREVPKGRTFLRYSSTLSSAADN